MGAVSQQEHPVLQPRNGDPSDACIACQCFGAIMCLLAIVGGVYGLVVLIRMTPGTPLPPQYFMEIAAVSGLDPETDLQGPTAVLNPVFNLTVRIASRSRYGQCLADPTSMEVSYSYLRIPLAVGRVPGFCASPWQWKDQSAVARGRAVAVPGFLLDSLAEDMRNGQAVFAVKFMRGYDDDWHEWLTCWVKVEDGSALQVPCGDRYRVNAGLTMPQPGDSSGHVLRPAVDTM